jgi:HAE1 family hydrophobic/amphiphilic exporter-1
MNRPTIQIKGIKFSNYHNFIRRILRHRWKITIVSLVLMGLSFCLVPYIGSEFMPSTESREFSIEVKMPEGTPLEKTSSAIASIEGLIKDLLGDNMQSIYSRIGPSTGLTTTENSVFEGTNTAEIKVVLKPEGKYVASQVVSAIASWYAENPSFEVSFKQNATALQSILGTEDAPIVVEVKGDDLQQIEKITEEVKSAIKDVPGLYNLQTNMEAGYPEVNVVVDRFKAGSYNLSVTEIVNQVTAKLKGQTAGQIDSEGELKDITIYVPKIGVSELGDMILKNGTQVIRLYEVAKLEKSVAPKEIYHRSQNRIGKVMSEINKNISLDKVVQTIKEKISTISLPPSYTLKVAGEEQKRQESVVNLRFALILSIVLVFMVMACQFESLLHPLIILLTIPFAIVGTVILFFLMHLTFNMMALIGIIMLGGIAVNDSIILIDRINQLRRSGMEKHEAIALGSQQRLRPILMMSIITVIALLPLTFGFGEGAALRSPMAYAVIGGMITSTLLTIIVIPCVYDLMTSNKPFKEDE